LYIYWPRLKKGRKLDWTCIKKRKFITKRHRRKIKRKTTDMKKRIWDVVCSDRERTLCMPEKKSTRLESVEKLDNGE